MKRHNITVHRLAELHISANCLFGQHFVFPQKDREAARGWEMITIQLRDRENRGRFLPLKHLLGTLTHELAHCWHSNHGLFSLRKWRELMSEIEMVLGRNVRLEPRTDVQKKQLRWLQWEDKVPAGVPMQPCNDAIQAAKRWEAKHLDFNTSRVQFYDLITVERLQAMLDETIKKETAATSDPEVKKVIVEHFTAEFRARIIAESKVTVDEAYKKLRQEQGKRRGNTTNSRGWHEAERRKDQAERWARKEKFRRAQKGEGKKASGEIAGGEKVTGTEKLSGSWFGSCGSWLVGWVWPESFKPAS